MRTNTKGARRVSRIHSYATVNLLRLNLRSTSPRLPVVEFRNRNKRLLSVDPPRGLSCRLQRNQGQRASKLLSSLRVVQTRVAKNLVPIPAPTCRHGAIPDFSSNLVILHCGRKCPVFRGETPGGIIIVVAERAFLRPSSTLQPTLSDDDVMIADVESHPLGQYFLHG